MKDSTQTESNVHVYAWETERAAAQIDGWPSLSSSERAARLGDLPPDVEIHTHNVTCLDLHEQHTNDLDPEQSTTGEVTHLALGDDDTEPAVGDRELGNEVLRVIPTEYDNNGTELRFRTFLDTGLGNGEDLLECGLVDDTNDKLWNHSLIEDTEGRLEPKTADVVATIIVSISWGDGS